MMKLLRTNVKIVLICVELIPNPQERKGMMAYFPNGTVGMCFDEQCCRCKYGEEPCPIYLVQSIYNYDACNNEVATKILDELVKNDGTCTVFEMAKEHFFVDINQTELAV